MSSLMYSFPVDEDTLIFPLVFVQFITSSLSETCQADVKKQFTAVVISNNYVNKIRLYYV
jgi:hypothetical protein